MKTKTPYLVKSPAGYRWQPPARWRALGFIGKRLSDDLAEAIAETLRLNDQAAEATDKQTSLQSAAHLSFCIAEYQKSGEFRQLSPATAATRRSHYKRLLSELGDLPVAGITIKRVQEWQAGQDLHPSTAAAMIDSLRIVLKYAVGEALLASNPLSEMRLNRGQREVSVWSQSDIAALICAAESTDNTAIADAIVIATHTGQRIGDILRMRWDDIADGILTVRQKKTGTVIHFPLEDKRTGRIIDDILAHRLTNIRRAQPDGAEYVITEGGAPLTESQFGHRFRAVKSAAQVSGERFHDFRATFITMALERNIPQNVIMRLTGHKSIANFQRYVGVTESALEEGLTKLFADRG